MAEAAPARPPAFPRREPPDEVISWVRRTLSWERRLDALRTRPRLRPDPVPKSVPRAKGLHC